jgi:hypothetical protein
VDKLIFLDDEEEAARLVYARECLLAMTGSGNETNVFCRLADNCKAGFMYYVPSQRTGLDSTAQEGVIKMVFNVRLQEVLNILKAELLIPQFFEAEDRREGIAQ